MTGRHSASHLQRPDQVHLNDALPFAGIELLEGLITAEIPGIVHKNVDLRIVINGMRNGLCDLIGLRYIDSQGTRPIKLDRIDVPNPNLCPGSHELGCDGSANPPRSASYNGRLASEIIKHGHAVPRLNINPA